VKHVDKAGTRYWDKTWSHAAFPALFDDRNDTLDNYPNQQLHHYFKDLLRNKKGFRVLEIGCANSIWPLYFAQYFEAHPSGLDYSEVGCEKSRALFAHHRVRGEVYCADLFSPPEALKKQFDLVVSFGVAEHFEDTALCLKSSAAFVKPGGLLFTLIPNMAGLIGGIQKYVDRSVYDVHVPLGKEQFIAAHKKAGLSLQTCDYFMSMNLSVVNAGSFSVHPCNTYLRHALSALSKLTWILEKKGLKIPKNKFTSPYIIAVCRMPS
jgi:cyclopropane fatty-acyl-phospholipid synthase-like methyltransferase